MASLAPVSRPVKGLNVPNGGRSPGAGAEPQIGAERRSCAELAPANEDAPTAAAVSRSPAEPQPAPSSAPGAFTAQHWPESGGLSPGHARALALAIEAGRAAGRTVDGRPAAEPTPARNVGPYAALWGDVGVELPAAAPGSPFRAYLATNSTSPGKDTGTGHPGFVESPAGQRPAAWLAKVEDRTATHRAHRAGHHRARELIALLAGAISTARWHGVRATGQRLRFGRVSACGTEWLVNHTCGGCGTSTPHPVGCGVARICAACRGKRAQRYRVEVRRVIDAVHKRYRFLGGRRDPWGWKLLTLTVPRGKDVADDARALTAAWPRFIRYMSAHLKRDRRTFRPLYLRCTEATPGANAHLHYHVLMFAPYIDHLMLRLWWGRALGWGRALDDSRALPVRSLESIRADRHDGAKHLERCEQWLVTRRGPAGRPLRELPYPVIDIRRAGERVEMELVKYLTKDIHEGLLVDPDLMADIYCALDRKRVLTATRGLWALALERRPEPYCQHCSERHPRSYTIERHPSQTGPPMPERAPLPRLRTLREMYPWTHVAFTVKPTQAELPLDYRGLTTRIRKRV